MTLIAMQPPLAVAPQRADRVVFTGLETRAETAVTPVPKEPVLAVMIRSGNQRETGTTPRSYGNAWQDPTTAPTPAKDPFPAMRFPDPLPDLPKLELPAKAEAYRVALNALRNDEPGH